MTIGELFESETAINIRQGNFDKLSDEYVKNEKCYSLSDIAMNLMILTRKLTIEEVRNNTKGYYYYGKDKINVPLDETTIPSDLNNIALPKTSKRKDKKL